MTHKVRLLDRNGYKVETIELATNILAGRAILRYRDRWYLFGGIVADKFADFDFREVEPPYDLEVPLPNVVTDDKEFNEAWRPFQEAGYQYGRDALENVRFGWDIAKGLKP